MPDNEIQIDPESAAMLPAPAKSAGKKWWFLAGRLILGYILAVGSGAIVFSFILTNAQFNVPSANFADRFFEYLMVCFIMGLPFGLPYTIIALLALHYLLSRSMVAFVILGMACPAAAIATMGLFLGMGPGAGMQQDIPLTLPAGLIATYIFGATGFGFGFDFRGWRPW